MRPLATLVAAASLLGAASASAACPQLSGQWACGPYGSPPVTYTVTQSLGADGKAIFSVAAPALGFATSVSLAEGADLALPKEEGFLAVSSFSCTGKILTLKTQMARRVSGEEVPTELLAGDRYPSAPTTIWNKTTLAFSLSEQDELLVRGGSEFSTNDPALRPSGSMPLNFSCQRR
jgi:hypothetical protein